MIKCEFCDANLKTAAALKQHQKTTKYCLKIQGKNNESFKCEYCSKLLSNKHNLAVHEINCSKKKTEDGKKELKQEIDRLKGTIDKLQSERKELQDKLSEIALQSASRPVTINNQMTKNQQINNLFCITDEYFKEQEDYFTLEYIKRGLFGYVDYALTYLLKDRAICTDSARRKIKYKNEDGAIISDPEMSSLSKKIFTAIKDKNERLILAYTKELYDKISNFGELPEDCDEKQLEAIESNTSEIQDTILKLNSQRIDVNDIAKGVTKSQFLSDFVKNVCIRCTQELE